MTFIQGFVAQIPYPLYYLLPSAAIAVIAAYCLLGNVWIQRKFSADGIVGARAFLIPFLLLVALLAVGNYVNFGKHRYNSFLNHYEFYHYYIGSKYAPEVRYTEMYNATIVAQAEMFGEATIQPTIRDLDGGSRGYSTKRVLERREEIKAKFTPERWEEWREDIRWFKSAMTQSRWKGMLDDKGYNATPVWSAIVGGIFSNGVPTSSATGMLGLALLDVIILGVATACVVWAFGVRTALFFLILLGTHYVMKFSHMKGAYLRTDFVVSLVIGVCMLRRAHYKTAGAMIAYATMSRIFPAVFLFGLGAKGLWELLANRRIEMRYVRFFGAYAVTIAALFAGSVVHMGGLDLWRDYTAKIGMHNQQISPWRVGVKYLFIGHLNEPSAAAKAVDTSEMSMRERMDKWFKDHKAFTRGRYYDENKRTWWAIQAAMLLVSFFLVRGLSDSRALIYGFVPCFFLTSPTYYYYIMLLVPLLFYAPRIERPSYALGLAYLLFTGMAGYYFNEQLRFAQEFTTYYWMSVMLMILVAHMMLMSGVESWRRWRNPDAPRDDPDDDSAPGAVPATEAAAKA